MTAKDIELEIATRLFNYRQDLIVPNASYGFRGFNECDLLICTKAGYLTEVEIKISRADILADGKKKHKHNQHYTKQLYFAIPEKLVKHIDLIPESAGVIIVFPETTGTDWGNGYFIRKKPSIVREAKVNKYAEPISNQEKYKLARLGAMRIWALKKKLKKNESSFTEIT